MLEQAFLQVLNMSATASFVIAFVLLARFLLKKAPKIFSYALWSIVLFRLTCPISFDNAFSLLPSNTPSPVRAVRPAAPQIVEYLPQLDAVVDPKCDAAVTAGEIVWLVGIAVLLGYGVYSFLKLRQKLIGAGKLYDNVYLSDHIATPFVLGVVRPKIYLPSDLPEQEYDHVILHEQIHIRHFDPIIKIAAFFALVLHWFNPLVWIAFFYAGRDMEMACDEGVIARLGPGIRETYSISLLKLMTDQVIFIGTPFSFGTGSVKERIKNVMHYRKPTLWVFIAAMIFVFIFSFVLLSNPKEQYDTYTVGEITVSVPVEFRDLVAVDTTGNDDWIRPLIAIYYKPAYDADHNMGRMFSIRRCSCEQMRSIIQRGADGVTFMAADNEYYYFYDEPTDVQWRSPEEYKEYEEIRGSILISFGNLQSVSADVEGED